MPNPIEPTDINEEILRLRTANRELIEKKDTLKARVSELEAEHAGMKARTEAAEAKLKTTLIDLPLRKMADHISVIPELWQEQFLKHYSVELGDKDQLLLRNLDGSPVIDKDKQEVPFEAESLKKLLYDDQPKDSYLKRVMSNLIIASRASGGGASASGNGVPFRPSDQQEKKVVSAGAKIGHVVSRERRYVAV